jgi:phage-related protein
LLSIGKTLGIVFGVAQLIRFGKEAVGIASDLQEVQNVVDTAFGDMAYKMEEFAKTSIETFGISKLAAKEMGSLFMAMSTGMGQASDVGSDMAVNITGRLADIMSFYNKTAEEVKTIGKAIYTGETEPLKAIGLVATETNLALFALQNGFSKAYGDMAANEKLLVRQQYFLAQTSLAAGDFAKTSDSWANQTRVLSEKWKEFLGILGTGLIQVLSPVVKYLSASLSYLTQFASKVGKILSTVFNIKSVMGDTGANAEEVAAGAEDASSGLAVMGKSAKKAAKDAKSGTASFDMLNNTTENIADNTESAADAMAMMGGVDTGAGTMGITAKVDADTSALDSGLAKSIENIKRGFSLFNTWLATSFAPIFSNIWTNLQPSIQTFKTTVSGMFVDIKTLGQPLLNYFTGSFTAAWQQIFTTVGTIVVGTFDTFNRVFSDIWNIAVFPTIEKLITVILPMIAEFATESWGLIEVIFTEVKRIFDMIWRDAIAPALAVATGIWMDFVDVLAEFWNKWGSPIFDNIKKAWQTTSDLFVTLWNKFLKPIWDTFMKTVDKLWTEHLKPLLANFMDFVGELVNGALEIYNKFIAPIVKWFVEKFGPPISKVISYIITIFGEFLGGVVDAVSGIITALKGIVQFITGVFTGDWKKAWEGVKNIFKGVFDALVGIVRTPINLIIDIINGMVSGIVTGINAVINAVNKISFEMPATPFSKAYTVGFNLKTVTAPKIPRLATGTVIPPNSEFLAILGDQKKGTNIEAPLDTIVAAFKAVTGQNGAGGGTELHLHVYEDGKVRYETVVKYEKENYNKTGKAVFVH